MCCAISSEVVPLAWLLGGESGWLMLAEKFLAICKLAGGATATWKLLAIPDPIGGDALSWLLGLGLGLIKMSVRCAPGR